MSYSGSRGAARQGLRAVHRRGARAGEGDDCAVRLGPRDDGGPGAGRPAAALGRDLRRVVGRNIRYGGEPIVLPTRDRRLERRPLVLLCDVSGSMERYSRMLLHFAHSLARAVRARGGVPLRDAADARHARDRPARRGRRGHEGRQRRVPDWGGGTRIGDALHTLQRGLGAARDGTRAGRAADFGRLGSRRTRTGCARRWRGLQRSCHRLIWLNPLLGSPDYQPLTRGMQAALPFVDDFLPVHNLVSLEALAEHLNALPTRSARSPIPVPRSLSPVPRSPFPSSSSNTTS